MAEQGTGAGSQLVIGFEDSFGALATDGFALPIIRETLNFARNRIPSKVIRANFNPAKPTSGRSKGGGQITVPLDSRACWYWFKTIANTLATTGTGPYDHTFKMTGLTKRKSITIEKQFLDLETVKYFQYTGCKITGFTLTMGDEGEILLVMDVVAAKRTIEVSPFDAAPTVVGYTPLDSTYETLKEGGVTFAESEGSTIQVQFNTDTSKYFIGGGGNLGAAPDGILKVAGNVSTVLTDTVLLEKAVNGTESSLEASYVRAADDKVVVTVPELQFSEKDPGIPGPQGIAVSLDYEGYFDNSAEQSAFVVTITNPDEHPGGV